MENHLPENNVLRTSTIRHTGVSRSPFSSLNLSYGVGDDALSVSTNRNTLKNTLSIPHLLSARQVHGDNIYIHEKSLSDDLEVDNCDALMTDIPGVGLMIQQADCQAITLYDPVHSAIAAIHSGWKGSVLNIIAKTIRVMQQQYNSKPADILAYISPSLGPCCSEFVNHATELPSSFLAFQTKENYFDFWQISAMQLKDAGLAEPNIEIAGLCTSCSSDYFSYRRACRTGDGQTGRCATLIVLQQ